MTRNQIIGAASSVFLLPSFVLTVVPTAARDPGNAICMALTVAALPLVPFAFRSAQDSGAKLMIAVLGLVLLIYNFSNALDALNGSHALATGPARDRMTAAVALNKKISELDVRKGQVDAHKIVSQESADAAQRSRDRECRNGEGPLCRKLDSELVVIKRDRGLTARAELIEQEQDAARAKLAEMGAVETTADRTADQIASIAGWFWAPAASSGDAISTNRPIFKAFVVELAGGLMPWVMVIIFGTAPAAKPKPKAVVKSKLAKEGQPPSKESVHAWAKERIAKREGRSIRAGILFADYEAWCREAGIASVNIQTWGRVMTNELCYAKSGGDKRTAYVGIGLKLRAVGKAGSPQKSPRMAGEASAARESATAGLSLPSS